MKIIPDHNTTENEPGVPIFPGVNTPLVPTAPPKNVPAPIPPTPAPAQPPTDN